MLKELLGSVRGLVFVLMAVATIFALFARIIDSKDFIVLVSMCFTAYFSRGRDVYPPTKD